ncbi:uncharacterized protein E0L32_004126 [Thyridium curvatum]|uniref:WSC domain-containing protein n=1 Tax=Thyridium curvatum TaxID=1093900 RepID=A0A507BGL8_9PEZI|nr:uncharacterized protein E0L32_004126 [Thyridium curvatum]TPX16131.1 hypothetical protein E0L32_004126 [Thyridium curvatum]
MRASWSALLAYGLGLASALPFKVLVVQDYQDSFENRWLAAQSGTYTVTTASKVAFGSMIKEQFASYDAIVIGDVGGCNTPDATALDWIDFSLQSKLGAAVTGNIYVLGTSLYDSTNGSAIGTNNSATQTASVLFEDAMNYVTAGTRTGFYISLSCYYINTGGESNVYALNGFSNSSATFKVFGNSVCYLGVTIKQPALFNGLTDSSFSAWSCPVREYFSAYSPDFQQAASLNAGNGLPFAPFILSRSSVSDCGNGIVTGSEICDSGIYCLSDCTCPTGYESDGDIGCRSMCGNAQIDTNIGEECELPRLSRRDLLGRSYYADPLCLANCTCPNGPGTELGHCAPLPQCGNGYLESGEECEPYRPTKRWMGLSPRARDIGDPLCRSDCTCPNGPGATPGSCAPLQLCGNGVLDQGEQCEYVRFGKRLSLSLFGREPLPDISDPLCLTDCTCPYGVGSAAGKCAPQAICGDGIVNQGSEECDDAGASQNCTSLCTCVNGYDAVNKVCLNVTIPATCGDGTVNSGEECEISLNGADLCSTACKCIWGVEDATLKTCKPVPVCGNSVVEKGEECEPKNGLGRRASDPVADDVCSNKCKCLFGLATDGTCNPKPGTTTTSPTSQSSTVPPVSTTASSSPSSSSSSSAPTSTSTNEPLPPQVGIFSFVGCTGSVLSYPSFRLQTSSNQMTLEMCTAACSAHLYAGVHVEDCYCSDFFDDVVTVSKDQCSVPCPGNALQNCGGYRLTDSRLARRQSGVPANALLVVYLNDPVASTATQLPASTLPPTSSSSSSGAAPVPQTTGQTTSTATAVVTSTATAVPCVNGWCNAGGYVFEVCVGLPNPGEIVFVMQACGCPGGWQYVRADCDGASCASLVVYRIVPVVSGVVVGDVVVYAPQPCDTCVGGVTFVQPAPPAIGSGSGSGSASQTGSVVGPTPAVVVTAGASKLTSFLSGLMVFAGAFVLLI